MPIQCRLVDPFPGWGEVQPGDMWFYAVEEWEAKDGSFETRFKGHGLLAVEYWRDNYANRPPLGVILPNGHGFYLDGPYSGQPLNDDAHGWTVTGEPPHITVSPSIHFIGHYHGWLRNGVLTDDIDGRKYEVQ